MIDKPLIFTSKYKGLTAILYTEVGFNNPTKNRFYGKKIDTSSVGVCIWDTGATNSAISSKVVRELQLIPISQMMYQTAGGKTLCNIYLLDIILPNGAVIQNINANEIELEDADALIGMDIITLGDFAISNYDKKTTFTFRVPSSETIDFMSIKDKIEAVNIRKKKGNSFPTGRKR